MRFGGLVVRVPGGEGVVVIRRAVYTAVGFVAIPPALTLFLTAYILLRLPRRS